MLWFLGEYLWSVVCQVWLIVVGAFLAVIDVAGIFFPRWKTALGRFRRRSFFLRLMPVFVFLAGFLIWREERLEVERLQAEGSISRLSTAEIARTIGKLQRYERVTELVNGNTIMLKHDPVPETVYLILGGFSFHVIDAGDCRLEGRRIVLSGEREGEKLSYARTYLAEGDVKVQYLEQPE